MEDLGGTVFDTGTDPSDIVASILAGITGSFADYSTVTLDDLGGGDPEIDVSVVCTSADIGACVGAEATGDYDRSEDRKRDLHADRGRRFDLLPCVRSAASFRMGPGTLQ